MNRKFWQLKKKKILSIRVVIINPSQDKNWFTPFAFPLPPSFQIGLNCLVLLGDIFFLGIQMCNFFPSKKICNFLDLLRLLWLFWADFMISWVSFDLWNLIWANVFYDFMGFFYFLFYFFKILAKAKHLKIFPKELFGMQLNT